MAGTFLRRDINGLTPLDIKNMNDNFKYMWMKVFGNLTTGDLLDGAVTGEKIAKQSVTADNIDCTTLVVGENITMGENATITWGNVTGTENIADKSYVAGQLANYVTTINLSGQLTNYLNSGNFNTYITKDWIGTLGLAVGAEILMGADATIGWDKVTGTDNVADKTYISNQLTNYVTSSGLTAQLANYMTENEITQALSSYITGNTLSNNLNNLLTNSNLQTILGQDYIITGKIAANQIAAGSISGVTIRTSDTVNYIMLEDQYIQIYNGDTQYVRLAYDIPTYGSANQAYLQLYDWCITGDSNYLNFNLRGTNGLLQVSSNGIATNGVSCQSLSTTNNALIGGNLTVQGTVSFSSTAYNVTAKFA